MEQASHGVGRGRRGLEAAGVAAALLALVAAVLAPWLLSGRFPENHEGLRYPALVGHFADAFVAGKVYPRWLPDLAGGYGYPTFVFYQPLFFFLALPFRLLGLGDVGAVLAAVAVSLLLGAGAAFAIGRLLAGTWAGLLAAAWFLLTPYLYVNLNVRGDFSELLAQMLVPWPIYFLLLLDQRVRQSGRLGGPLLGLTLSLAALVPAHPATALFAWPTVAGLAGGVLLLQRSRFLMLSVRIVGAFAAALALSAPYWWPVLALRDQVNLAEATKGYFEAFRHTVHWHQFLATTWGFGHSEAVSDQDQLSFQLGLPHLAVAVIGLIVAGRSPLWWAAGAVYAGLLLLMSDVCKDGWVDAPLLPLVQFPWRLLSVTASVQLLLAAGLLQRPLLPARYAWVTAVLGLVATGMWYQAMLALPADRLRLTWAEADAKVTHHRQQIRHQWETFSGVREFMPRTVRTAPPMVRGDWPMLIVPESGRAEPAPGDSRHALRQWVTLAAPGAVLINQFYLPGWRVVVDGRPLSETELRATLTLDGRMLVPLPSTGPVLVEATYAGPPGSGGRAVLAWLTLVVGLALVRRL